MAFSSNDQNNQISPCPVALREETIICKPVTDNDNNDTAIQESQCTAHRKDSTLSQQLLYSEKFKQCYEEKQLCVTGKSSTSHKDKTLNTFPLPKSSVLSKAKDFMSLLSQSNNALAKKLEETPEKERQSEDFVTDGDDNSPGVEMDVMLVPTEDSSCSEESSSEDSDEENKVIHSLKMLSDNNSPEPTQSKETEEMKLKTPHSTNKKSQPNPSIQDLSDDNSDLKNR